MKRLLLALLLASSHAWAALATGTIALYEFQNAATDSSGNGYTLNQVGTNVYVTSPAYAGTYSAGTFTAGRYFYTPAGLNTALSSLSTWYWQGYLYFNSLPTGQHIWFDLTQGGTTFVSMENGGAANNAKVEVQFPGGVFTTSASILTTGEWWFMALANDGSNLKVYASKASAISQTPILTLGNAATGTVQQVNIGNYRTAGYPVDGYFYGWRFMTQIPATLPAVDTSTPSNGPSLISPDLREFLTPRLRPSWSMILDFLLPPAQAKAAIADQESERIKNKNIWEKELDKEAKKKHTPTPTPNRSLTATRTVTPSPTPTRTVTPKP